jgi:hypothetical protein
LLEQALAGYRGRPHPELAILGGSERHWTETGPSGTEYQLAIVARWDATAGGAIRVLGSAGDGGWGSCLLECAELLVQRGGRARMAVHAAAAVDLSVRFWVPPPNGVTPAGLPVEPPLDNHHQRQPGDRIQGTARAAGGQQRRRVGLTLRPQKRL